MSTGDKPRAKLGQRKLGQSQSGFSYEGYGYFRRGEVFGGLRSPTGDWEFDYFRRGEPEKFLVKAEIDTLTVANVNGVSTVSCTLVRVRARTASVTCTATVSCTLVRVRARTASVTGTATVSCTLKRIRSRTAAVTGAATVSCSLKRVRARSASVSGTAVVSCTLRRVRARTASVSGTATVTCDLTKTSGHFVLLTASVHGSADVSCTLTKTSTARPQVGGHPRSLHPTNPWLRQQIEDGRKRNRQRVPVATAAALVYTDRPYGKAQAAFGYVDENYVFATPSLDDELAELIHAGLL